MNAKDFEQAIDRLTNNIVIDEMRYRGKSVREVIGHTEHSYILWDQFGRGFSAQLAGHREKFLDFFDPDDLKISDGVQLLRNESFDLNFGSTKTLLSR